MPLKEYQRMHGLREQIKRAETLDEAEDALKACMSGPYPEKYKARCQRVFDQKIKATKGKK